MPRNPSTKTVVGNVSESTSRSVAATEFKATCLALMDEVSEQGTEITVTKHGRPIAKLVPIVDAAPRSIFGCMKGMILWHGDIVSPDQSLWEPSPSDPLWQRRSKR